MAQVLDLVLGGVVTLGDCRACHRTLQVAAAEVSCATRCAGACNRPSDQSARYCNLDKSVKLSRKGNRKFLRIAMLSVADR
jgi:hypothetical protein